MDTEKVICYDRPGCGNDNVWPMMAAMNNGGGFGAGGWNNPFAYILFMMFMRNWGGNEWGGCNNPQIAAMQNQMQDNQNSNLIMDAIRGNTTAIGQLATNLNCDFNTLNSAIQNVRAGIDNVAGQVNFSSERVINAINMGDCRMIEALNKCCCETQKEMLRMRSDTQLQMCQQTNTLVEGQRTLQTSIERGFATLANEGQRNTQRLIDHMDEHWREELRDENARLRLKLSQSEQNQYIDQTVRRYVCGCGCGCNCGGTGSPRNTFGE